MRSDRRPTLQQVTDRKSRLSNMNDRDHLQIAEFLYESGKTRFRYSRYLSPDGGKWIRHGLFRAYHENGQLASEGEYENGLETGVWRDYHDNGQLAAEGEYRNGKENGRWRFWTSSGQLEKETVYFDSVQGA
jgi:antitoxin component YwqK of YwqJK toxin-antitoxin module